MKNKNVIILLMDGSRLDRALNSSYFNEIEKSSAFFSHSITYGPHTIAAMHAIFSGTYGVRTGTNSYWSTFNFKKNEFKTLTEYFQEKEYFTCSNIVSELVIPRQGFDEFTVHDEEKDDLSLLHTDFLHKMKDKNNEGKNFFLFLQYSNIHTTIMNEVLKVYDNFSKEFFDNRKENENRYDKLFKNSELYLEIFMNECKKLGFFENSIIVILSDHGISVGEKYGERAYGAFCYDYTLRTFAYFIYPELKPIKINQQVRTVDFMPTILDILNIEHDLNYEKMDGESLLPLINGKKIDEKFAFSETGNPLKEKQPPKEPNTKSIRTSKWKLILNEYDDSKELYDLESDPKEEKNLSGKNLEMEKILWNEMQQYL